VIGQASAPLVAAAINRLTKPAPLSRERLGRFAGKTALFRVGPVAVSLTVQTTGEVLPAAEAAAPDLEVRVSPFLLPRLAAHDEAAYRDVETLGDVEFAGEVAFLAKHLRWDAEEDPLIASRVKVEDFIAGVSELRDAVERLDKRIERIEKSAG